MGLPRTINSNNNNNNNNSNNNKTIAKSFYSHKKMPTF